VTKNTIPARRRNAQRQRTTMKPRCFALARFCAVLILCLGQAASAELLIVSESAVYCLDTDEVYFSVVFNEPPDFHTVDQAGRQADSFQYYVDYDTQYDEFRVLIRGEEIHWDDVIPIRDRDGYGGDHSGGWGPIRGVVPYTLDGSTLRFVVPLPLVGDSEPPFSYRLTTVEYGSGEDSVVSVSTMFEGPCGGVPVETTSWTRIKVLFR
jgi:hypothetical protein